MKAILWSALLLTLSPIHAAWAATTLEDVAMWDYRGTSPGSVTLSAYHGWLASYCSTTPPNRLVLYVSSPCLDTEFGTFYDPNALPSGDGDPTTFVDFLVSLHGVAPNVEVEVLLDRSSFPASGASAPCWSGGTATQHPTLPLPTEWTNLPLAMDWLGALASNAGVPAGVLAGVTIDPEVSGTNAPGSSCAAPGSHAVSMSYQQVADWVDAWKHLNGHTDLRQGMTFEVDSANMARLNVATFPLETSLQSVLASGSPELDCRLDGSGYPSWRSGDSTPILQSCYLQVYVVCGEDHQGQILQAASFWRWQTEGGCDASVTASPRTAADAADSLVLNMTQQAGSPGPGTVEVATGVQVSGVGTRFLDWAPYTRLSATKADGTVLPTSGQWKIDTLTSDTVASGYGSSETTGGAQLPYHYSELVMNWHYPYVTADMAGRIWPMFSVNKTTLAPFFGFLFAFAAAADGSSYAQSVYSADGTTGVPLPPNWGVYDLQLACDNWGIGDYPSSNSVSDACAVDLDANGYVEIGDLLLLLEWWGTPAADLNGSGVSDADDVLMLLSVWGETC